MREILRRRIGCLPGKGRSTPCRRGLCARPASVGIGALVLVMCLPAFAAADIRYAAPGGNGADPCAMPNDPCSIYAAADGGMPGTTIEAGDIVQLAPGTYSEATGDLGPSGFVNPPSGVTIGGETGQPRPLIVLQAGAGFWGAFFLGPATTLTGVEIRNQAPSGSAVTLQGGAVETVIARSTVSTAFTCTMFEGEMRSSACVNTAGGTAIGVSTVTFPGVHASVIRNSTFVATGPGSVAMDFAYFASSSGVTGAVNAIGVIARGEAKDVIARGLESSGSGKGATTAIELVASNFATVEAKSSGPGSASVTEPGANGSITAAPLLADDHVHQLVGSPTIDKGAVDGASAPTDIDGQLREVGLAPDIGADEIGSPTITSINCEPQLVALGASANCTVTVKDAGNAPTQPGGTVAFAPGLGLALPASCTLIGGAPAMSASCSVSVGATGTGVNSVIASYGGDGGHEPSKGSGEVTVSQPGGSGGSAIGAVKPPATKLRKHPAKVTFETRSVFKFSSNQGGSRFECSLDHKPFRNCHSPFSRSLSPGSHSFRVRAVNAAGKRDTTPARFSWKILAKRS